MQLKNKISILWGIGSGLALLLFYFLILTLANSFSHALSQFSQMWYWILILVVGFGIQVGLYSYIRAKTRNKKIKTAKGEIAVSGSASTVSMIACCAHHLVDILPVLGLPIVFLFLAKYQISFIIFGIFSNIFGIIFMLEVIKKHNLIKSKLNFKTVRNLALAIFVPLLLISFVWIKNTDTKEEILLLPKADAQGGVSIEVEPLDFSFNKPVRFKISFDTHSGDLDFDLTKQALLIDDRNNQYLPLEWQGGRGGHHLSGTLIFSSLSANVKTLKLKIFDIYGIKEREFFWEL